MRECLSVDCQMSRCVSTVSEGVFECRLTDVTLCLSIVSEGVFECRLSDVTLCVCSE